ncbi:MAG TPA: response regulator [Thermoleophilaceae bacterium]
MQPDVELTQRLRAVAVGGGLLVLLAGALGLAGWLLDVDQLKSIAPGVVTMKANTALCFLISGPALVVFGRRDASARALRLARLAAAFVGVVALLTLSEYAFGWRLGIDELLFHERGHATGTLYPNRMALNSAIAFVLWAIAVQLLDRGPRAQRIAAGAAIAVAVMGFVALVAYLSGLRALFGIAQQSQMAVPSAVSCLILGIGLLHARPEREPVLIFASQTSGGALARRLVPIVILVPVALAVMRHRGQAVGLYPEAVGDWLYVLAVIGLILPMVYSFVRSLDTLEHERRSAAQMLESRELEYKALAENAVEAIISTDERGLIVYANRSTERIFGWPPEELLGERLTLLMPERLGEAQFAELTELATALVDGTSPPMVELTGLTKSGIEFPYELSLSHFSDGESVLFTGVMRDISTAKRAAQRSAARYGGARALAEASTLESALPRLLQGVCEGLDWQLAAAWFEDADSKVLKLADVWSDVPVRTRAFRDACCGLEFKPGEGLPGGAWGSADAFFIPDVTHDDRFTRHELAEQIELRGAISVPVVAGGRAIGALEFFSRGVESPEAELLETMEGLGAGLGLFVERRRAEEALRASQARLQGILDNTNAVIYLKDLEGRYLLVNKAFERLVGVSSEDAVGSTNHDLLTGDAAEQMTRNDAFVITNNRALEAEEHVMADGQLHTFVSVKFPLRDQKGVPYATGGVSTDITDRKQAELEVIEARDEAIAATRMKSEFLANMSHEIRTPMNGLIGMTELLLDGELEPEQREYAELLRSSGETLVSLVNDLLDLSKIEAGKVEIDSDDFRLGETVEDVCDLLAGRAREKGVQLSVLIDAGLPDYVRGDQTRLRQVLSNIVANAVKFTNSGEVAVRAWPLARTEVGAIVSFEVRDTGIGIEGAQLERLWQPFEQADSSTTRRFGGTGLGLTIAKQLSQLMGGEIAADSVAGRGSTFLVTIPFDASPLDNAVAGQDEERGERLHDLRLLVVDDNATNRRIISHHAHSWLMRPEEAETGAEALELLRTAAAEGEPFDVVVTDLHMPGMDGLELARAIGADEALHGMRLILLSSGVDERRAARGAGFDDYIPKPVRRAKLYETLAATRRGAEPESAPARTPGLRQPLILVAEDNEVNQLLAVRMLERRGFRADVAGDGRQALRAIQERDYDLVFMDCQMPEMDGYAATKAIREHEGEALRVPIVAMTAHSMRGDRERCLAAGMDDYLSKPLDQVAFDAALERWLGAPVKRLELPGSAGSDGNGDGALDPRTFGRLRDELAETGTLPRLVEIFSTQTPERVDELRQAIGAGDHEVVLRLAHTMKGGAASLGATKLAEACKSLEELARDGELGDAADTKVDAIEEAFEAACEAMEREVAAVGT